MGKDKTVAYGDDSSGTRQSARIVGQFVYDLFKPKSVVDLGCGNGTWLREWQAVGMNEILGVEGLWGKDFIFVIPKENTMLFDLSKPITMERKFDVALSVEVAEHLPESSADGFVQSLVGLSDLIVFSGAVPKQGGFEHLNEQWQDYWIDKFKAHGFRCFDTIRQHLWNDERIVYWYLQNTFFFVRADRRDLIEILEKFQPTYPILPCVHPRLYLKRSEPLPKRALRIFEYTWYWMNRFIEAKLRRFKKT